MVKQHGHRSEEGKTATLQPQEAEEIRHVPVSPHSVLQDHHREHSVRLHHSLVQQLHHRCPQGTTEGCTLSRTHHWLHTACPPRQLQHQVSQEGKEDHQGTQPDPACFHGLFSPKTYIYPLAPAHPHPSMNSYTCQSLVTIFVYTLRHF